MVLKRKRLRKRFRLQRQVVQMRKDVELLFDFALESSGRSIAELPHATAISHAPEYRPDAVQPTPDCRSVSDKP